ncbi:MAG: sulfatase [Phycisphaerales bacterium]
MAHTCVAFARRALAVVMMTSLLALAPACASRERAAADDARRPNIIYIMADDHAAHALSCYGSRINRTPNLDRLASQGVRFTNAFCTNSICTPMRAVILTGQYSHKNGVRDNSGVLPLDAFTVPMALAPKGYQTAHIGKWHLNRTPSGFDHWDILPGQGRYMDPEFITREHGTRVHAGYVTDITLDKAMDWIGARDQSRPFLLYCHLKAPHREWTPDPKHAAMFAGADVPVPATFDDDYATRTAAARIQTMTIEHHLTPIDLKQPPPAGLDARALKHWKYQRYIKDYLGCIASIDDNVGRLMQFLDEQNLSDDTVVIYTSDQGFFLGDHGWYDKRFMYEESLRFPLIVRYPREIPAGTVCDAMVTTLDYAPTFLDFGGIDAGRAADAMRHELDGRSFRPLLREPTHPPGDWRTSVYYHYYESGEPHTVPKHYGVRTRRYKLIRFYELPGGEAAQWELYDLERDPHELKNLAGTPEHAEVESTLRRELVRLRAQFNDTTGAPLK